MNIIQQLKECAILIVFSFSVPLVIHFSCNTLFNLPSEERYNELYNVVRDQKSFHRTEDEHKLFAEQKRELAVLRKKYEQELSSRRRLLFIPLIALSLFLIAIAIFLKSSLLRTGFLFSGIFLAASTLISSAASIPASGAMISMIGWIVLLGILLYYVQSRKL